MEAKRKGVGEDTVYGRTHGNGEATTNYNFLPRDRRRCSSAGVSRCSSLFLCTFDLLWRLSCCCARVNVLSRKRALGVHSASGGHYSPEQIINVKDARI